MFVEGAAMLIRWKQGTQKVKANFDNAAKTRAGIAQPGTAKRGRERELPRHPSTSQVSVTTNFSRLHSTVAIIPRQPLRKGCVLARCRPQRLAVSPLLPGCWGYDWDKISPSTCPKPWAEWTKHNLRKYDLRWLQNQGRLLLLLCLTLNIKGSRAPAEHLRV